MLISPSIKLFSLHRSSHLRISLYPTFPPSLSIQLFFHLSPSTYIPISRSNHFPISLHLTISPSLSNKIFSNVISCNHFTITIYLTIFPSFSIQHVFSLNRFLISLHTILFFPSRFHSTISPSLSNQPVPNFFPFKLFSRI